MDSGSKFLWRFSTEFSDSLTQSARQLRYFFLVTQVFAGDYTAQRFYEITSFLGLIGI